MTPTHHPCGALFRMHFGFILGAEVIPCQRIVFTVGWEAHSMTRIAFVLVAAAVLTQSAAAQESKAAKFTREKLKQVIAEFDDKEVGAKAFFEDVNREIEKEIKFKIDGTTGISNNTKFSYKAKKVTVEKLLNDVADKYEFGWYVISNPGNNKEDGHIVIRRNTKGKERGYELGKEPKDKEKTSSLRLPAREGILVVEMQPAARMYALIATQWRKDAQRP
jgi:hypothetical protein